MKDPDSSAGSTFAQVIGLVLLFACLSSAVFVARRNYRQGRSDRAGALKLAGLVFALQIAMWLFRSHLSFRIGTIGFLIVAVSTGLFVSAVTWLLYLALEPWVRRNWPQTIISWSRALSGQLKDPLVGRDILFGVILGVIWILIFHVRTFLVMRLGAAPPIYSGDALMGVRQALGAWLEQVPQSILGTLQFFFLLLGLKVMLQLLFRFLKVGVPQLDEWLAAVFFVAIFALPRSLSSSHPNIEVPTYIVVYAIAVLIVLRFGLMPLACAIFTVNLLGNVPFSSDFSVWYMPSSMLALASVLALTGWGFYYSLGGQPLLSFELDPENA
jgi:hypothetical protein